MDDPEHHNHDGFYLRISLPFGWQATRFRYDASASRDDLTVSGAAYGLELRLGGTPAKGLVLGVQLYSSSAREDDVVLDKADASVRSRVTAQSGLLGFFVDYFPDPRGNFNLGGSLGLATHVLEHEGDGDVELDEAAGLGASGWVGYGWWISKNWSLGGLGQVTVSGGDSTLMTARSVSVVGMFSLLYH